MQVRLCVTSKKKTIPTLSACVLGILCMLLLCSKIRILTWFMNEANMAERAKGQQVKKKKNAWLTGLIRLENLGHLAAIYGYNLEV